MSEKTDNKVPNVPNLRFPNYHERLVEKRFSELAYFKKGPFGSALKKEIFVPKSDTTIKVYEQPNAIYKDWELERYFITSDYYEKMKSFTVNPGDIIVSCAGTIGEIYTLPMGAEKGVINQALMIVRPNEKIINKDYFIYIFEKMIDNFTLKFSNGSAIKNIPPFADLKNHITNIPSIHEQNKIVAFLSKIDERITTQSKIIDKLKSQIISISNTMVKSITKKISIEEICDFERKTKHQSGDGLASGTYPFFTNEEENVKFFDSYDFNGEYIIANTGGKANFKYYNGKFAVMSDCLVIKFKSSKLTNFYSIVFSTLQKYIDYVGFEGSGLKHLNKDWLLKLQVPQYGSGAETFIKIIDDLKEKLQKEKDILSLYKKQKAYLLSNMFI